MLGDNGKYGWIIPVGVLAGGGIVLNKLGILKFTPDNTKDVPVNKSKLTYSPAFYKTNADELYNNLNSYWTNGNTIKQMLAKMKTADDIRELFKQFGNRASTLNAGILDFNVGGEKDLKQWLLDAKVTAFSNQWVIDFFSKAGL